MTKSIEYAVVEGSDVRDVEGRVNAKLSLWWELYGPLNVASLQDSDGAYVIYSQAMTRKRQD